MSKNTTPYKTHSYARDLADFLHANPDLIAAWFPDPEHPTELHVLTTHTNPNPIIHRAPPLNNFPLRINQHDAFKTMEAPIQPLDADNPHQACQDEPVQLGTQIQPRGALWLGTAGAPVRWKNASGADHWGILSNWHVMVIKEQPEPTPQHQPLVSFPAIAHLRGASPVRPDQANIIDAAIADALLEGKHTISPSIIGIGTPAPAHVNATVGLYVQKAGRTTMLTNARCTAVGAAVQVGYQDFLATFQDQDIYTAVDGPFSAAGDSGSLIVSQPQAAPVSLLFAGGGDLTIGNPYRHIAKRFNLQQPFIPESNQS